MNKISGRILLIIVIVLITLLVYKTLKNSPIISAPTITTVAEKTTEEVWSKEKIEEVIKDYILNNPNIIIESIEQSQKPKLQENEEKVSEIIKEKIANEETERVNLTPFMGNSKGDIIIVSFYDYNCSYCKKGNYYINQLLESDKEVKLLLRPFPILGDSSSYAAKIALAVYKNTPAKFQAIHEGLLGLQLINKENVETLLTQNGINYSEIEKELSSPEITAQLDKNFELAGNLKVQGAPAYIINGKIIPGMINLGQFQQLISEIRAQQELES